MTQHRSGQWRRFSILMAWLLFVSGSTREATGQAAAFVRSDTNADGMLNITDGVFVLGFLFLGGPTPPCLDAADADDSGDLNITDGIFVLGFLFLGSRAPPEPGPAGPTYTPADCGGDPSADALDCQSFPPCPPPLPLGPLPTAPQEGSRNDRDGDSVYQSGHVVLPSGEVRLDRTDLQIPGRGEIHFSMTRRYRSRLHYDGPLGFGWDFSFNESLRVAASGDVERLNGNGHVDVWTRRADGSYTAPRGHFRTLRRQPDGSFLLRSPNGYKRSYDAQGRLSRYEDRHKNQMHFAYDARGNLALVIDPYGREVQFTFEPVAGRDRLVRLQDFIGREVRYSYDAAGNLVAVRTPVVAGTSHGNDFPEGRTERYAYLDGALDLDHNLTAVTFPQEVFAGGTPALTFSYGSDAGDPTSFDRALSEIEGGTNASGVPAGGTRTFAYQSLAAPEPPGTLAAARLRVAVRERNGNSLEVDFNELGQQIRHRRFTRGLRASEPASYEMLSSYNEDHLLLRRVFPELNEMRTVYDAEGPREAQCDLLELRLVAGPRGGGEDLVYRYTYEPLYHQVATQTDPRGTAAAFVPPLGAASAARYTTRTFFDYQESSGPVEEAQAFGIDLTSMARGLGDLNDDGRIDQTAGNAVRLDWPRVVLAPGSREAALRGSQEQEVVSQQRWNDRGQPTSIINPEGNVAELSYFPANDPDGDGTITASSSVVLGTEPTGYLRSVIADASVSPRRRAQAAPVRLETRFARDRVGNLVSIVNPRGVTTRVEVNQLNEPVALIRGADVSLAAASGQLTTGEAALAHLIRLTYDHNGRVVRREIENQGGTTPGVGAFVERTAVYDILGNAVEASVEVDAASTARYRFRYDGEELLAALEKPEGNRIENTYDERHLLFTVTRGAGSPEASMTRRDYDLNGNLVRLVDAEDHDGDGQPEAETAVYDGFDHPLEVIDALGNRLVSSYDPASNVVRRRFYGHPPGQPQAAPVLLSDITLERDELQRIFRIDQALFVGAGSTPQRPVDLRDGDGDGRVTTFLEYDALSRPTFITEDDGQVTRTIYDGASRIVERRDAAGNRRLYEYDRSSNPTVERVFERATGDLIPEQEFVTFLAWDQLDRLVQVAADHTTRYTYDSRDNIIAVSDPQGTPVPDPLGQLSGDTNLSGNTTTYSHDGRDLLTTVTTDLRQGGQGGMPLDLSNPANPDGRIELRYRYDLNSRLTAIIDDNGNETRLGYDALDRGVEKRFADGTREALTYDRDDNLVEILDPNLSRIRQTFDVLNRLVRREATPGAGVAGTTLQTFAYDGMSRLTAARDDNGATASTHDVARVHDSLARILEEVQDTQICSNVWSGDSKHLEVTYPGGRELASTHDAIDRTASLSDGAGAIALSDWIGPERRLLRRRHGNDSKLTLLNDSEDDDAGYDSFQRVEHLRHVRGAAAFVDRLYQYNRASQRLAETRGDDGGRTDAVTYDSAYRIAQSTFDAGGAVARDLSAASYVLDGAGNRREETRDGAGGPEVLTHSVNPLNEYVQRGLSVLTHDRNGNLTGDGIRTYTFDSLNRLVAANSSTGNPLARYEYDALDRRVKKTVFDPGNAGSVLKETWYLYDNFFRVIEERGPAGVEVTYAYGEGIDEPIQMQKSALAPGGAGTFYLHQNARGDVVAVTDAAGAVVERTVYDDFGRPYQSASSGNPYLFQGMRYDAETGLYYVRHRYYDPRLGRFIQRDPLFDPNNAGNQYTFAGNGPWTHGDPAGLKCPGLARVYRPSSKDLTFGEWLGGFWDSLTEDSWAAKSYKEEQKHIEEVAQLYFEQDYNVVSTTILSGCKLLSDFFGSTDLYEAASKEDLTHFVSTGNQRLLGTAERVIKAIGGILKVIGTVCQASSVWRGVSAWALELRAASGAAVATSEALAVQAAQAGTRVSLSNHGRWLGTFFRLPENVTLRFHQRLGMALLDEIGQQIDLAAQFGVKFLGPNVRAYFGRSLAPDHVISYADDLLIWIGDKVVRRTGMLSQIIDDLARSAAPGEKIFIEFSACRNPTALTWIKKWAGIFFQATGEAYSTSSDKVRVKPPPPPLTVNPDRFVVPPGAKSTLNVALNDTSTQGGMFMLVTSPALDSSLFMFNADGTFMISPLTVGGQPLRFSYKVVKGQTTSATAQVTFQIDPRLLYQLEVMTDPQTQLRFVVVPCLVLGNLHYPIYQFRLANNPADVCQPPHWHADGLVYPLEVPNVGRTDPDPPRCGFGIYADVPQEAFQVSEDAWQDFLIDHIPPL